MSTQPDKVETVSVKGNRDGEVSFEVEGDSTVDIDVDAINEVLYELCDCRRVKDTKIGELKLDPDEKCAVDFTDVFVPCFGWDVSDTELKQVVSAANGDNPGDNQEKTQTRLDIEAERITEGDEISVHTRTMRNISKKEFQVLSRDVSNNRNESAYRFQLSPKEGKQKHVLTIKVGEEKTRGFLTVYNQPDTRSVVNHVIVEKHQDPQGQSGGSITHEFTLRGMESNGNRDVIVAPTSGLSHGDARTVEEQLDKEMFEGMLDFRRVTERARIGRVCVDGDITDIKEMYLYEGFLTTEPNFEACDFPITIMDE